MARRRGSTPLTPTPHGDGPGRRLIVPEGQPRSTSARGSWPRSRSCPTLTGRLGGRRPGRQPRGRTAAAKGVAAGLTGHSERLQQARLAKCRSSDRGLRRRPLLAQKGALLRISFFCTCDSHIDEPPHADYGALNIGRIDRTDTSFACKSEITCARAILANLRRTSPVLLEGGGGHDTEYQSF
jgi:hypothetical protein